MTQHPDKNLDSAVRLLESELAGAGIQQFSESDVPEAVRALIPFARYLGDADDWARERIVARLSKNTKSTLKDALRMFDDDLDAWLAGNESYGPTFSDAYIAFSAMRMAID